MMNPQFPPPGQNNNAPANPLGYPGSQDFNGVPNPNYHQNGPQPMKPYDQDMSQKMQNMNLNGPTGFPAGQIPPGQVPPGPYPPNYAQGPPGQRPGQAHMQARPPVSGAQFPPSMGPPSSATGPVLTSQGVNQPPNQPPSQFPPGPPMQRPPSAQSGQGPKPMPQMGPPQPGMPPHPGQGQQPPQSQAGQMPRSGLPPQQQPGQPPQGSQGPPQGRPAPGQGFPPQSQVPGSFPAQPGPPMQPGAPQQGKPNQPGFPQSGPHGFPQPGQGLPPQPGQGLPPQPSQGLPPQPSQGLTPQPGQGLPPQPGQGLPPQSNQGFTSQPGQLPSQPQQGLQSQPGFPPHQNQFGQPGLQQQPNKGLPPQPGQGLPPQPGQYGQPGLPPQGQGLPPQPGQGIPPQQGQYGQPGLPQPGLPPQPQPNQGQMSGLPFMPPPLSQQRQYPGPPGAAGAGAPPGQYQPGPPGPPGPAGQQYPGMPPPAGAQPGYPPQPPSGYPPQFAPPHPGQQPPHPGQQPPFTGQQPSYPNQQYHQPEQKRLDPDQMPSPIQVMADDQQNRSGVFVTNDKGLVPPLVTTDFVVDDKGNASPRYMRSSMYTVPVTADLLKQTAMPFCVVISPMAEPVGTELPPPLLDFAALTGSPSMGPVRCSRCKAYMCPSMKFVDAGRHFQCAFCKATTEVPMEYTQYINSMQQYGRVPAELALGAYEIVATKEYCRNNTLPNPPAMVFVIDVSYNSIKSGLLDTLCENIMSIIDALPKDERGQSCTRVGFITYSSTVHFYNIKGSLAQPQMLSVGDVADVFVPLLEGFLVRAEDSGPVLAALLQLLPAAFRGNRDTETVLLPAVQAGLEALKAADTSGQLLVFHTSLPTYNAPGKLLNREDRKLLGTDKEKTILAPQTTAYNELGQACAAAGVSVEMFVCNNSYVDAATIGQLPRLTGGQIRKYTYFTAEVDGARLVADARRVATRPTAHDAVMRLRTSTGVRATDFYGHFYMANTTDVELAAIDSDKAIGIEIKHDDKLTEESGVFLQAALLYTARAGQRRLRVLTLALGAGHQLADVYRAVDTDTALAFLAKQAVWALREAGPRAVRAGLSARCARSLAAYRRHCASPSSAGQLVLPESMKLLPLYTSCLLRSDALSGGPDISCDDRSCAMYRTLTADVLTSLVYTYPRLLPLHNVATNPRPSQLRASIDKMADTGVYLLENGVHILIWVGANAPAQFVSDVFGVGSAQQIDTQVAELPALDTPASAAVRALVQDAREKRHSAMRVTVMRQHDKLEAVLRHFLVEDRGVDGSASYVDFLCHVHKEIRALL